MPPLVTILTSIILRGGSIVIRSRTVTSTHTKPTKFRESTARWLDEEIAKHEGYETGLKERKNTRKNYTLVYSQTVLYGIEEKYTKNRNKPSCFNAGSNFHKHT